MSLRDDIAGLPGGGDLAGLIGRIERVNGHAVEETARSWRTASRNLISRAGGVAMSVSALDGAWEGASADAFVGYMDCFGKAAEGVTNALTAAAEKVEAAGHLLEGVKNDVNSCGEKALAEARKIQAEGKQGKHLQPISPTASRDNTDNVIFMALKGHTEDARKLIATAERELQTVAKAVREAAEIKPAFTELPAPGGETFTPAVGKPVDWRPEGGPGVTTSQGVEAGRGEPRVPAPTGGAFPAAGGSAASGHADGGGHVGDGGGARGGVGPGGPPPAGGGPAPQGQVADWINQAIEILKAQGYPVARMNPNDIWNIIQHESGGNPDAVNNRDSNAAGGTPSKGLMQCVDSTFNAYRLPGHDDIHNPVDNIIAGVRYSIDRYGSVSNVPGVVATKSGGDHRGY